MYACWVHFVPLLVILLLWPASSFAYPTDSQNQPIILYRGDTRAPEEIKFQGGFLPPINPAPHDKYRITDHIRLVAAPYGKAATPYISTTPDFIFASKFAKARARYGAKESFVYHVHATPHIFRAVDSVDQDPVTKGGAEGEYDALGGIPWRQILGWTPIPLDTTGESLMEYLAAADQYFVRNREYDTNFDQYSASGGQPLLNERNKDPAQGKTAYDYAIDFMNRPEIGACVGWKGEFPLFKTPDHDQKLAAARRANEEATEAAQGALAAVDRAEAALKDIEKAQSPMDAQKYAEMACIARDRAVKLAREVAAKSEEYIIIKSDLYEAAMGAMRRAISVAAVASKIGNIKTAKDHAKEAERLAKLKDQESAIQAIRQAQKVYDLKGQISAKFETKLMEKDKAARVIEGHKSEIDIHPFERKPKGSPREYPDGDFVWAESRESFDGAIWWAGQTVNEEFQQLRETLESLAKETSRADKAREKAENTLLSATRGREQTVKIEAQDHQHNTANTAKIGPNTPKAPASSKDIITAGEQVEHLVDELPPPPRENPSRKKSAAEEKSRGSSSQPRLECCPVGKRGLLRRAACIPCPPTDSRGSSGRKNGNRENEQGRGMEKQATRNEAQSMKSEANGERNAKTSTDKNALGQIAKAPPPPKGDPSPPTEKDVLGQVAKAPPPPKGNPSALTEKEVLGQVAKAPPPPKGNPSAPTEKEVLSQIAKAPPPPERNPLPPTEKDVLGQIAKAPPPPKGNPSPKTSSSLQLKSLADSTSSREFSRLIEEFGLRLPKNAAGRTLAATELHTKFKANRPALSTLKASKWGSNVALTVTTLPWFIQDLNKMYKSDMTDLQKAAVLTSIVPLIRCSVGAAAEAEQGQVDIANLVVCYVSDALLLTPLFPIGIIIKAVQHIAAVFIKYHKLTSLSSLQSTRDEGWQAQYKGIKEFISSEEYLSQLRNQYTASKLAVLFALAGQRELLAARWVELANTTQTKHHRDVQEIYEKLDAQWIKVRQETCADLRDIEHRFRTKIPNQMAGSLGTASIRYDKQFAYGYRQVTALEKERMLKDGIPSWTRNRLANTYDENLQALWNTRRTRNSAAVKKEVNEIQRLAKDAASKFMQPDLALCEEPPEGLPKLPQFPVEFCEDFYFDGQCADETMYFPCSMLSRCPLLNYGSCADSRY
ncbi:putative enterotoxin [Cordyceps sp. RAO-2017]|nr:putative enterotoxin [Cordyceps sp. RAO-2017]